MNVYLLEGRNRRLRELNEGAAQISLDLTYLTLSGCVGTAALQLSLSPLVGEKDRAFCPSVP